MASDGRTWVSYDDEAVFNAGSAGLIRLSSDGRVEWTYETPAGAGAIYDCELLNVATDAVWACYWVNYPVVRIDPDDSIAWWTSPRNAPGALAVSDRWFTESTPKRSATTRRGFKCDGGCSFARTSRP